jgi:multidrug resistance efflux pump
MTGLRKPVSAAWAVFGIVAVLLAVGAGAVSVLWREHRPAAKQPPKAQTAAPPETELSLPGRIQARHVVPVGVRVSGKLEAFDVEVGQEVYAGQLLAHITNESLKTTQDQAALAVQQAQAQIDDLDRNLIAARLEASRARADAVRARTEFERAEKNFRRQKMLLDAGATPRLVYDKSEKDFNNNRLEFESLRTIADQAESRITAMQKQQESARKDLDDQNKAAEEATAELAAGELHSPVDGIVTARRGEVGDDVNPSIPDLFQIATDLGQLDVVIDANPEALSRVRPGAQALVTVAEMPGEALAGQVRKAEKNQIIVEFTSPNPQIRPGVTAQVKIKLT